ncbi:MAG TPA: hypothetical protein VGS19_08245 [Streptosporangiaceae bacterium]|nr:hypothetical protein [Streptosporangiaceae bacterium]
MSRRLLWLEMPVFPERRKIRLRDAAADLQGSDTPPLPTGGLISAGREQMWIASLQENVGVRVALEEWEGAPPPFGEEWEDEAKAVLYLRGAISIDTGRPGSAVDRLRLAGGVGDYVVRVYARNRREVVRLYSQMFERGIDPLGDGFQQARRSLEGREQYLLQLWRES